MSLYKKFQVDISNTAGEASSQRFESLLDEVTLLRFKNFSKFFFGYEGKKIFEIFFSIFSTFQAILRLFNLFLKQKFARVRRARAAESKNFFEIRA